MDIKAVIMAGGEGTRLRPLSANTPKPMVRLLDRPVMEYIINLLKRHGFRDIIATTQYMPEAISGYFGDGSSFGVNMRYSIETEPLGTAGSIKLCGDYLEDGDFLVISGDGVCDLDLTSCVSFHREKNADATLVLYASGSPLEYGLVMTDRNGRIERFIEKPSWGQVFTDLVNTGIYILSPRVMDIVPENTKFDFARDLFPMLLGSGAAVYGVPAKGYWCDMGDIPSYLKCTFAALKGEIKLDIPAREISPGIWSAARLNPGATFIPPCYIGEDVTIGKGAVIGPCASIGRGSEVGEGAAIIRSVMDGAYAGPGANINGAVLCRLSKVKGGASLTENCALGSGSVVGEMASIAPGVRVWPEKEVAPGIRLEHSVVSGEICRSRVFDDYGTISGEPNFDLTPEFCMRLGMAISGWADGEVAVSCRGDTAARVCASAFEAGVSSAGNNVVKCDALMPSAAAFASKGCGVSASVFAEQSGDTVTFYIFNRDGLPPGREASRKIEGAALRCEYSRANPRQMGGARAVSGVMSAYSAAASAFAHTSECPAASRKKLRVSISGPGPANDALRAALALSGCRLHSDPGLPVFQAGDDGFSLSAIDETGHALSFDQLLAIISLLEFDGGKRVIALPYNAPKIIDEIAKNYSAQVLRVGRDGADADRLFAASPHMNDGIYAAARICGSMIKMNAALHELRQMIPAFGTVSREIPIQSDRSLIMRLLADMPLGSDRELFEGLRISTPSGWVHISPHFSRPSLRIVGESSDAEMAEELCVFFEKQAKALESEIQPVTKSTPT